MTKHQIHVYTRISKTSQQEGSGLDEQLSRIDAYIKSKPEFLGSEITYWQDVGVSAFKNKNIHDGQLAEFIKQVESGSIGSGHALVIYSLDRLSRRSSWDEDTIQKLVKNGVDIHDVSTPVVLKRDDPFSKIIMELIVARGNNESRVKSERSIAGWEKRLKETREQGKVFTRKLPRWLSTDKNGYVVITEQAELIKRIFLEYTNGLSSPMIAHRLNEEGIKSTGRSMWRPNTITKLIKDERLRGYLRRSTDQTLIPDIFPVVIDEEIFVLANRILKNNASGIKGRPRENNITREVNNILTGIVRCGKCGARVTTSKNSRGVRYVVCLNRRNYEICGQKSIKLDEFEKIVISHAQQVDMSKVFSYDKVDTSHESTLNSELSNLEIDEKNCIIDIEARKKAKKTASLVLANTLVEIQDRIEEIKQQLLELKIKDPLPEIQHFSIDDLINPSNIELRMSLRKFLTQAVDKITFRSLDNNILIEIKYYNNVYRHILITDKKVKEVLHEVDIVKNGDVINYTTNGFLITENERENTCIFHGIYNVHYKDYFLLANYIGSLKNKHWIVDKMYETENMSIVMANEKQKSHFN